MTDNAGYAYDGDGHRIKATINGQTTLYIGAHMEYRVNTGTLVKYYYAGNQRVAMREGSSAPYFFLSDHLGSTSLTLNANGTLYSEMRYKPFGETVCCSPPDTPTQRRFTGQIQDFEMSNMTLYFYNARYYDPALGRFTQADTIVPQPGNPQTLNRYSYALNNPLYYVDPTGHFTEQAIADYILQTYGVDQFADVWKRWYNDKSWWEMLRAAGGGDSLALISPDLELSWLTFSGSGQDSLTGIYGNGGPGGLLAPGIPALSGRAVEKARGSYALIGGLFATSRNGIHLRWAPKGQQKGKNGFFGTVEVGMGSISAQEYWTSKGIAVIGGAAVGAAAGGVAGAAVGTPGGPATIGVGFIVGAGVGAVIEESAEPPPPGSIILSFTVDMWGPGQNANYDWYYGRSTLTTVGQPIRGGYNWLIQFPVRYPTTYYNR